MIRPVTALGMATTAAAGWAGPALFRARALRAAVCPGLAGVGRPGSVALTFDDGPDPDGTPAVLDALDRLGWTATFFMLGGQVARYPGLAALVVAAGHEAAVHGFSHRNHLYRGPVDVYTDVAGAAEVVTAATGAMDGVGSGLDGPQPGPGSRHRCPLAQGRWHGAAARLGLHRAGDR